MKMVRSGPVTPVAIDFTSPFGTPIVINTTSGDAYIYVNGTVVPLNIPSVKGFGAKGDGTTDDTAAFTAALAAHTIVWVPEPASTYLIGDVTIGTGKTLMGPGAYYTARAGSTCVFKLTGFKPRLEGGQISDGSACSDASIIADNARDFGIKSVRVVNSVNGFKARATVAATGCARGLLDDVKFDTYTTLGVSIEKDTSEIDFSNVLIDAGTIAGTGGQIPRTGATGFLHTGTGSTVAYGGHSFSNMRIVNAETGFRLVDSNLINATDLKVDGCSGVGVSIEGSSNQCRFHGDIFIGSCGRSIQTSQTSTRNSFVGLTTILAGVIPPAAGSDYYTSSGLAAPFINVGMLNTSNLTIDVASWRTDAGSIVRGATAVLNLTGGQTVSYDCPANVAAATTAFFGPNGDALAVETGFVVQYDCTVYEMTNYCNVAPGAGQTFTYTLREDGVDMSMTSQIAGAAVFVSTMTGTQAYLTRGRTIDLKLVTSAGAAASRHRGSYVLIPVST